MDKKNTNTRYSALFFRQEKLRRLLESGSSLLMGHMAAMNHYMEESGTFSPQRTEEFIEDLLKSMQIYLRYKRRTGRVDAEKGEWLVDYYRLREEEKQYYRDYLYCCLISLYVEQTEKPEPAEIPFSRLISMAHGLRLYGSYQDLLRQKYLDPGEYVPIGEHFAPAGISPGRKPDLYRELCDFYDRTVGFLKENMQSDLSGRIPAPMQHPYCAKRREWQQMLDSVSDEEKERRKKEIDAGRDVLNRMAEDALKEETEAQAQEPGESALQEDSLGEWDRKAKEAAKRKKELLGKINMKVYREHLRGCLLHQDCLNDRYDHIDAVTGMINAFLMNENVSLISDADRFYSVYVRLESAFDYAQKSVSAEKNEETIRGESGQASVKKTGSKEKEQPRSSVIKTDVRRRMQWQDSENSSIDL